MLSLSALSAEDYVVVYKHVTGKEVVETTWTIIEKKNTVTVYMKDTLGAYKELLLDKPGLETRTMFYRDSEREIRAEKKGLVLEYTSKHNGRVTSFKRDLEPEVPWIQTIEWGCRNFIRDSKRDKFYFYRLIEVHDEIYKVVMMKEGLVKPDSSSSGGNWVKVRMTLDDWRSIFYTAYAWYSESGDYMKYRGANGPPGTPETLVSVLKFKTSDSRF